MRNLVNSEISLIENKVEKFLSEEIFSWETPMIQRLRAHLSNITSEQFNQEIAEIESQGFQGITMEEFS